ncbi:YceI family protein [Pseudomonas sp. MH9.2]|uniref:YceI family protein n=1 Tax=unclassified Pseudomonas TaxID=196821 RepID=UPI002AC9F09B|nr:MULTISPECIES: YceI family protein [unclassified Pseudomonas]MEB0009323.1 YceI family protein [Pseudomonas sp. RTB2]MEB0018307.1 YceI family protein [Pseudomonas sp. RTB3]MEB0025338.1 YceI family protein [Pseudomonas sp. MH9.2]MEB0147186.1 YceI family protein [Pseudomonas sp. CCC2.2]MEB0268528.1 YceI family protein [Pseudomonas sp. 5B4]
MNPRFLRFTVLAAVVALGFLPNAHAVEYTDVNPTASTINFTYNQMGSKVHGTFSQFVGALDFDTSHPEAAHAKLTIELGSIDAGSENANTELKKTAWFDTTAHPVATFESSRFKDLGGSHYQITGNLTLKGVTREVLVPVLLKSEGAIGIFDGELLLKRGDFNVGVDEWSDSVVSDNITIRFRMVAPER